MHRTLRARPFALALAALAALASCDSPAPLATGEGRALPPEEPRYATAPFPAPANFTVQGPGLDYSSRTVTLTWEDVPGDEMYLVQWRRGDGPDVWKSLVTTGVNRTSYVTDSITFGATNDYRVAVFTSDFRAGAFATLRLKPGAFTRPPSLFTDSTASLKGYVRPHAYSATYWFEWGTDPSLVGAAKTPAQQASWNGGSGIHYVQQSVRVAPGGVYYYRLAASNTGGTTFGEIRSFVAQASVAAAPANVTAAFSTAPVPLASGAGSPAHNVTVRWTHDGAALSSFRIQRQLVGTSSWKELVFIREDDPAFLDRRYVDASFPVNGDSVYDYRVVACVATRCASGAARATTLGLPAPGSVSATQLADGRVALAWQDLATEEGFSVQWRAGETGSWQGVVTPGRNVTSYTTDRVTAGVNNYYRVAGEVRQYRVGAYAQTVLSAGAGRSMVVETGTAGAFNSPTSIKAMGTVTPNGLPATAWIEWGTDPALAASSATAGQAVGSGVAPVSFETVFNVPAAGKYYYRAAASNTAGTVRGAIRSFDTSPPPAPALAAAFDGALFRVSLSWTYSGPPLQFRVERRPLGQTAWRDMGGVPADGRSFVDAGVPVDSAGSYQYRVRVCGASCTYSNLAPVQTQPLAAPGGLTAAREASGQVTLSWQDVAGEVAYLVQWRTDPAGPWKHVVSTGANRTSYTTASVTPGVTNHYRVSGEASGFRRGQASVTSIAVP